jgi:hypothetical protein
VVVTSAVISDSFEARGRISLHHPLHLDVATSLTLANVP